MTNWAKVIEGKIAIAAKANQQGMKAGKVSADARIPQGQSRVSDFPVLDIGIRPKVARLTWSLRLFGLVGAETTLDWNAFMALPQTKVASDMHCVTRWSQLDMDWEGVLARDIVMLAKPTDQAQFVTLHGLDGYTTNLPLDALLDDDVLVAHRVFGEPLSQDHGWSARLVVPKYKPGRSVAYSGYSGVHRPPRNTLRSFRATVSSLPSKSACARGRRLE